jgi:hypothetical protein
MKVHQNLIYSREKQMKTLTLIATGSLLALGAAAQAVTIANWTFESSVPTTGGPHSAEVGTGEALGVHADASTVFSNPVGNGSSESFSSNFWGIGDYYQFKFSLTGFEAATITWDQTRSGTGPSDFKVAVSTDGVTFNDLTSYVVGSTTFSSASYNAALNFAPVTLTGTDGEANVWVRLIATSAPSSTGGSNRVDNVLVDATDAVPEPASMAILGLGIAALAKRKRK